jgi:hypothetical protein
METTLMEVIHGVIHGKTVELQRNPGIADGEAVEVVIRPLSSEASAVELLRRSAGGWAEDTDKLDEFLAQVRRDRRHGRADPQP